MVPSFDSHIKMPMITSRSTPVRFSVALKTASFSFMNFAPASTRSGSRKRFIRSMCSCRCRVTIEGATIDTVLSP